MKTLTGFFMITMLTVACSGPKSFNMNSLPSAGDNDSLEVTPTPTPEPSPSPTTTPHPSPTPIVEATPKDVTPLWEAKIKNSKEWSDYVYTKLDTLGDDLLDVIPADRATFCPKYSGMSYNQRKQYWTFMLSAMARFESNFNTNSKYTEDFNDSNGKAVVSRGLLQISIESGNGYDCGLKTAQDLHDPLQNLACGIRILNRWVARDGRIAGKVSGTWRGGARYWSVLREGDKTSYQSIMKWSKALSICN
jgi:hypothetical protein